MTEAGEFWKIYKLDVIAVPTNRPMRRDEGPDVIYRTEREKFAAIADEIERINRWDTVALKNGEYHTGTIQKETDTAIELQLTDSKKVEAFDRSLIDTVEKRGRPILVGTVSIEKSER